MTRNVHHVVNATQQPQVAFFIPLRSITGKILALELRPVGLFEAVWVAPDSAQHRRPGFGENQQTGLPAAKLVPLFVENRGCDARQRHLRRAWLQSCYARQRRHHDCAGLGLPPGVNYRGLPATDVFAVPHPCFRVDWFTNRAEQSNALEVVAIGNLAAQLHEGANRGWRGVKNTDAILFDDAPPATPVWCVWRAFVNHLGCAVGKRPVGNVRVAGDPADVCGAPVDIALGVNVENVFVRVGRLS